jgi:hypothetical protein
MSVRRESPSSQTGPDGVEHRGQNLRGVARLHLQPNLPATIHETSTTSETNVERAHALDDPDRTLAGRFVLQQVSAHDLRT